MKNRRSAVCAVFALLLLTAGCASKAYVIHPGSPNLFDSQSYDVLVTAHAAIEQAKTELAAGKFAATAPQVKLALNALIDAYDVMDVAYTTYHTSAVAGTATAAQVAALQNGVGAVNNAMGGLTVTTGGK